MKQSKKAEPLLKVFKRQSINKKEAIKFRAIAISVSVIISITLCSIVVKKNPFIVIAKIFEGVFIDPLRFLENSAMLLCFGVAIIAPFKMKYWNMGAGGSVMMSALASYVLINIFKDWVDKRGGSNALLLLMMFVASIIAGVIWSTIPAIFKAFFNTNETLFTLMMNYIAMALTLYVNYIMAKEQKLNPGIVSFNAGYFPTIIFPQLFPIIIIVLITILVTIYMNKTKHGYEVTVLGDSPKTAQYVGMKNKKIIIRTLLLSGVICGILGFLYVSCKDHMASDNTGGSLGFTGVLVGWLSNFNTITMAIVSLSLTFIIIGAEKVCSVFNVGNSYISSILVGIIFFSILISEFFIRYKLVFSDSFIKRFKKEEKESERTID